MRKLTQGEALQRLQSIHPGVEFPNFHYSGSTGLIQAICPIHGSFQRRYDLLVKGKLCPSCGSSKKGKSRLLRSETALTNLKMWKPNYNFGSFVYVNSATKSTVMCPEHGPFESTYSNIQGGHGCPTCKGSNVRVRLLKSSTVAIAEMIAKAPHYDFSSYEFKGVKTKGKVLCPTHGEFLATHGAILRGRGCPSCGVARRGVKSRLDDLEALKRVKEALPEYDYSEFRYESYTAKVLVGCTSHGRFSTTYGDLVAGRGCPVCSKISQSIRNRVPFPEFTRRVAEVHSSSLTCLEPSYTGVSNDVIAVCQKHGEFKVLGSSLLNGQGCPDCSDARFNPKKRAYFYLYKISNGVSDYLGFGITTNLYRRRQEHAVRLNGKPYSGELVNSLRFSRGYQCAALEAYLKTTLPITPLGVRGFKTEACEWELYGQVLSIAEAWHSKFGKDKTIYVKSPS